MATSPEEDENLSLHDRLLHAAFQGKPELCQTLLARRAYLEHTDSNGHTPLQLASMPGEVGNAHLGKLPLDGDDYSDAHHETVKLLIKEKAALETYGMYGGTPLMYASKRGNLAAIKTLIDAGANIDNLSSHGGHTALIYCVRSYRLEAFKLLIERRANPDVPGQCSPLLHFAAGFETSSEELMAVLLDLGLDYNATDSNGETPLQIATKEGTVAVVLALLEASGGEGQCSPSFTYVLAKEIAKDGGLGRRLLEAGVANRVGVLRREIQVTQGSAWEPVREAYMRQDEPWAEAHFSREYMKGKENACKMLKLLPQRKPYMCAASMRKAWVGVLSYEVPWCRPVVAALGASRDLDVVTTDAAVVILEYAWNHTKIPYMFHCGLEFVFLGALTIVTGTLRAEAMGLLQWLMICIMLPIAAKSVFEEIADVVDAHRTAILGQHLQRISVWMGWLAKTLDVIGLCRLLFVESNSTLWKIPFALWCTSHWIRSMYMLRALGSIGKGMLPILYALRDTLSFIVVVAFCFAGLLHYHYSVSNINASDVYAESWLPLFDLGFGPGYDVSDLVADADDGVSLALLHSVHYGVVLFLTIIGLNLLVGVLSLNYDRYLDVATALFLQERADIIDTFACYWWPRFLGMQTPPRPCSPSGESYLWFSVAARSSGGTIGTTPSMRSWTQAALNRLEARLLSNLNAQLKELKDCLP